MEKVTKNILSKKQEEFENIKANLPQEKRRRGFTMFPNSLLYEKEVGVYGILVYLVLCFYAMDKVSCYPSINTIARKAKCSRNTVMKYLKKLEALDLIQIQKAKPNSLQTNTYIIRRRVSRVHEVDGR